MKLKVTHQTIYTYESQLNYLLQFLHLQPMQTPWQNVLYFQLKTQPKLYLKTVLDMHGNYAHILNVVMPDYLISTLQIKMNAVIETQNTYRFDFKIIQDERLGEKNMKEGINPIHYLRSGHLTQTNKQLEDFARNFLHLKNIYLQLVQNMAHQKAVYLNDVSELDHFEILLIEFAKAICQKIPYSSGATDSNTSAMESFELGAGVCQDHAHIALALLRYLNIPARYVSGYFYDPTHPNMASHAWIDVILPIGFISLDVTHHRFINDAYVRLAHGFDYADIALIKGVREGGGCEQLSHTVKVSDFLMASNL
jgi:hypothetical protein